MKKNDLIRQKALEILINEPNGVHYAELVKQVNKAFPSFKFKTIQGALWDLHKTHPEQIYKPSYGLFRHMKYKEINNHDTQLQEIKDEEFYDSIADWFKKEYVGRTGIDWKNCSVHVEKVKDRSPFPTYLIRFFLLVKDIKETKKFNEMLTAKDENPNGPLRKKWQTTKRKLGISTRKNKLDFKQWTKDGEKDVFSVRVGKNWRAHLWWDQNTRDWYAIKFGTHKEMGHG